MSSVNESVGAVVSLPLSTGAERVTLALDRVTPWVGDDAEGGAPVTLERYLPEVERVNTVLRPYGVVFEVSGDPPETITRLVDRETGEVIRQYPSDEMLRIAGRIDQLKGLVFSVNA
ncbi:flagellar protein FlaG [Parahaliea aestuarii]|uniref:Flagellar protein FlaG n=1 Tax=Parahaliea aestuarii TaxID=1852021 RepID=A0A5C8ZM04_9GAMM|nr:flagellar protein FlaG [Parahaliea aestuarii]TXS89596.1 flagellar protein FlaG [Parahaliea aestuarii]